MPRKPGEAEPPPEARPRPSLPRLPGADLRVRLPGAEDGVGAGSDAAARRRVARPGGSFLLPRLSGRLGVRCGLDRRRLDRLLGARAGQGISMKAGTASPKPFTAGRDRHCGGAVAIRARGAARARRAPPSASRVRCGRCARHVSVRSVRSPRSVRSLRRTIPALGTVAALRAAGGLLGSGLPPVRAGRHRARRAGHAREGRARARKPSRRPPLRPCRRLVLCARAGGPWARCGLPRSPPPARGRGPRSRYADRLAGQLLERRDVPGVVGGGDGVGTASRPARPVRPMRCT